MRTVRSLYLWTRGWAAFLLGAPPIILASFLLDRARVFRLVRVWCRLMLRAVGVRVELTGVFPRREEGPLIVVAPHVNLFDPIVLGSILPRPIAGIELETHFRWPLYGTIIKRLGHIPISHASPHRSRLSLSEAVRRVEKGESLVVLPEGHRTRTGERRPFGLWAFRLAARTGAGLLPIAFAGAWQRQHVGSWHIEPGIWRVHILPPIPVSGSGRAEAERLKAAAERALDGAEGEK